jgi:hypothetical protein
MKFQMCGEKLIRLLPRVNVWTCEPYRVVSDERSLIEYTVHGIPDISETWPSESSRDAVF